MIGVQLLVPFGIAAHLMRQRRMIGHAAPRCGARSRLLHRLLVRRGVARVRPGLLIAVNSPP